MGLEAVQVVEAFVHQALFLLPGSVALGALVDRCDAASLASDTHFTWLLLFVVVARYRDGLELDFVDDRCLRLICTLPQWLQTLVRNLSIVVGQLKVIAV